MKKYIFCELNYTTVSTSCRSHGDRPYPRLIWALAAPTRHGWQCGTAQHCQPDAAGLGGAAVYPDWVLEAPVRPGRLGAWEHRSGHRAVGFNQIHIPHCPHGPLTWQKSGSHSSVSWLRSIAEFLESLIPQVPHPSLSLLTSKMERRKVNERCKSTSERGVVQMKQKGSRWSSVWHWDRS